MAEDVVIGVDIGGTNLRIGVVDSSLTLHHRKIDSSQAVFTQDHPVEVLSELLMKYMSDSVPDGQHVRAIAIGFPATVDAKHGRVIATTNITNMNDLDVVAGLSGLGVPIFVDRDANMQLRHDMWRMGLDHTSKVVFGYYLGTGIGGAFSIYGNILSGKHGVACELGHIPLPGVDAVCGCGNVGCVEAVGSGRALETALEKAHPGYPIHNVFLTCRDEGFVREWLNFAAVAMATGVNIIDPDEIIVGGGVVQTPGFPRDEFLKDVYRMVRKPLPADDMSFHYPETNPFNGVIGAGILAFQAIGIRTKGTI